MNTLLAEVHVSLEELEKGLAVSPPSSPIPFFSFLFFFSPAALLLSLSRCLAPPPSEAPGMLRSRTASSFPSVHTERLGGRHNLLESARSTCRER